jgi:predicted DNA-binding transcriptional regulator
MVGRRPQLKWTMRDRVNRLFGFWKRKSAESKWLGKCDVVVTPDRIWPKIKESWDSSMKTA